MAFPLWSLLYLHGCGPNCCLRKLHAVLPPPSTSRRPRGRLQFLPQYSVVGETAASACPRALSRTMQMDATCQSAIATAMAAMATSRAVEQVRDGCYPWGQLAVIRFPALQDAACNTRRESHRFSISGPSQLQYFMAVELVLKVAQNICIKICFVVAFPLLFLIGFVEREFGIISCKLVT